MHDLFELADHVPGIVPQTWKEVRKRPRQSWVRTPPFSLKRHRRYYVPGETPQETFAERALQAAKRGYVEAAQHMTRREVDDAVDVLQEAFRNAMIAATISRDELMREMADAVASRISRSLRAFSRVTLGFYPGW